LDFTWFKKGFALILSFFMAAASLASDLWKKPVTPTPLQGRDYTDGEMIVPPDVNKYLNMTVLDAGTDLYEPTQGGAGYRYGPSVFVNADGSLDAWFAAPGGKGEWDWITYRHSPDGGKTWTAETRAVYPTPDSMDFYSTCDPGAVKFGGYYYIGYTSTIYPQGVCNNVFVARSRTPQGPYEKWNGADWGGKPQPIVYFDEDSRCWGAGEPSFVVKGETLYIYYTWTSRDAQGNGVNQTRVATADARDANWPATMIDRGVAADRSGVPGSDSMDVKFIDDYGKFVAVSTSQRLGPDSYVSVYESDDGLSFEPVNQLKTNISYYCHNAGISSRPDGHIRLSDRKYLAYAYGPKWGVWATRIQAVDIGLVNEKDFSDAGSANAKTDVVPVPAKKVPVYLALTTSPHFFERKMAQGAFCIDYYLVDTDFRDSPLPCPGSLAYSGYDPSIIRIKGNRCVPLAAGQTEVTATTFKGLSVTFTVYVRGEDEPVQAPSPAVKAWTPVQSAYAVAPGGHKQIRGLAVYEDNTWFELCSAAEGVVYSGYDAGLIDVTADGIVTAAGGAKGTTTVTVRCGGFRFDVPVTVL